MWELDHKEGWVPKNWCFPAVVLEKTLESPLTARRSNLSNIKEISPEYSLEGRMLKLLWRRLSTEELILLNCGVGEDSWESLDCKETKSVNPRGNPSWIFIGRTAADAETPILWPPDAKNWLIGKDPDAGKDWRQEEKGTTEDEMAGWHHWLNGHEFEQVLGVGDGQGSLACCSPWGHKESDMTEQLNWTEQVICPVVQLLSHMIVLFQNGNFDQTSILTEIRENKVLV